MNKELKNKIAKFLVENSIIFEFAENYVSIDRYSIIDHIFINKKELCDEKQVYDLFFKIMSAEVGETIVYSMYDDRFVYCCDSDGSNKDLVLKNILKSIFNQIDSECITDTDTVKMSSIEKIFEKYIDKKDLY